MKLLLPLLLVVTCSLQAQSGKTIWSATATVDLQTSNQLPSGQRSKRAVFITTPGHHAHLEGLYDTSLGAMLFRAFTAGKLTGYQSADCRNAIAKAQISDLITTTDTVQVIDPTTYETSMVVETKVAEPKEYTKLRLSLQLTLNAKGFLQQDVVAIAMFPGEEFQKSKAIFIKPDQLTAALDLQAAGWNIVDLKSFELYPDALVTDAKSPNTLPEAMTILAGQIRKSKGKGFNNPDNWARLSTDQAATIGQSSGPKALTGNTSAVRLIQYWAWDDASARLVISPVGYAPLKKEKSETGNLHYYQPLVKWAYTWYREQ